MEFLARLDQGLLVTVAGWRTPGLNDVAAFVTSLGSTPVVLMCGSIAVVALWLARNGRGAVFLFAAVAGGEVLSLGLKRLFQRERPSTVIPLEKVWDYSFPSGHAILSTVLFLSLAYLLGFSAKSRRARVFLYLSAFLVIAAVGFSRVYLGVHYPSDVLGGVVLGILWIRLLSFLTAR